MSAKKRKSLSIEKFIPGELTLTTAQFIDELRKADVIAFEMVSSLRPLAINLTQLTALRAVLEKRNKSGDYAQLSLEFAAELKWRDALTPVPIATFKFVVAGTDKEPMDAFAINDLIDELAPFMIRKSGPSTMRDHLKTIFAKEPKVNKE